MKKVGKKHKDFSLLLLSEMLLTKEIGVCQSS